MKEAICLGFLIDQDTGKFTRGQYDGETILEVAESGDEGVGYLYFLIDYSDTDDDSKSFVEDWLIAHPEFQEE